MWPLAIGPKEQVGIAPAQDAMLETMSLDSRRLNDRLVGPPSRLVHDKARHAVPDFPSPAMPRDPGTVAEQKCGTPLPPKRRYPDCCFKHDRMSSRTRPVFDAQGVDSAEFSRVVRHEKDVQRCRVSANQRIEWSYRSAAFFKRCVQTSAACRRVAVVSGSIRQRPPMRLWRAGIKVRGLN
jgi:hypothetical protein